jgi:hypothetical protein
MTGAQAPSAAAGLRHGEDEAMTADRSRRPGAWKAAEIGGKEGLIHRLSPQHVAAFDRLVEETRGVPTLELTRDHFRDAALEELMLAARDTVQNGHGAIVLSGLPMEGRSLDDFEKIHWYVGTHFGRAVAQSGKGDRIGHVRHVSDSKARGYQSDMELGPHTDYHEVLSLASFARASRGGLSGLSSAITVHDEMMERHPDLLAALYDGYYNGMPARYGVNDDEAEQKVPVFSVAGGEVSAFTLSWFQDAANRRGEKLPEKLTEAFRVMREIAESDEIQARFMLEPGEMLFWNNRTNFHSRTRFENDPGVARLLLRLWIEVTENSRPVHPGVAAAVEMIDRYHAQGLDQRETIPA